MNDKLLEEVYRSPEYVSIVRLLFEGRNRRAARMKILAVTKGRMSHREVHEAIRRIQLREETFAGFVAAISNYIADWIYKGIDMIKRGAKAFLDRVAAKEGEIRRKVEELSIEHGVTPSDYDAQELTRKVMEMIPSSQIPQDVADGVGRELGMTEHIDDKKFSVRLWVHKWMALFILYGIFGWLTGMFGSVIAFGTTFLSKVGFATAAFTPVIGYTVLDLLKQLQTKELVP